MEEVSGFLIHGGVYRGVLGQLLHQALDSGEELGPARVVLRRRTSSMTSKQPGSVS